MTGLLELRDKIKYFFYKNETYVTPALRFVLGLITFITLNSKIGSMAILSNFLVVLFVSAICAFLPTAVLVLAAAVFSLGHMFSLSMELSLIGLAVYLIMYLLYFRLGKRDVVWLLLTVVMFFLGAPYLAPIAVGLLCEPLTIIPMAFGVIVYYLIQTIGACIDGGVEDMLQATMQSILSNGAMVLVVVTFVLAAGLVYVIRRLYIDNAWKMAVYAGAAFQFLVILVGGLIMKTKISIPGLLLGTILAVAGGLVIEFFRMLLDYRRTEEVQYEDDEYYYYVKAVPKVTVQILAEEERRAGRANAGRRPAPSHRVPAQGRTVAGNRVPPQARTTAPGRGTGTPGRTIQGTGRPVQGTGRPIRPAEAGAGVERTAVRSYPRGTVASEEYNES